ALTLRAFVWAGRVDPVAGLVDDQACVACVFVERHVSLSCCLALECKGADPKRDRPHRHCSLPLCQATLVATSSDFACIACCLLMFQMRAAFSPNTLRRISGVIFG